MSWENTQGPSNPAWAGDYFVKAGSQPRCRVFLPEQVSCEIIARPWCFAQQRVMDCFHGNQLQAMLLGSSSPQWRRARRPPSSQKGCTADLQSSSEPSHSWSPFMGQTGTKASSNEKLLFSWKKVSKRPSQRSQINKNTKSLSFPPQSQTYTFCYNACDLHKGFSTTLSIVELIFCC